MLMSGAKYLVFFGSYEGEILRLSPQDDIATQSPRRVGLKQDPFMVRQARHERILLAKIQELGRSS
jgi:hypothetical protein